MATGNITVRFDEVAHKLTLTGVWSCAAFHCRNNRLHLFGDKIECNLQHINIDHNGRCTFYEPADEEE